MELWAQALIAGIWVSFCLMGQLWGNYFPRCLVYAFGIGLIMGDVQNALLMGGTAELAYMGFGQGAGGVSPPNNIGPGVYGTVWVINSAGSASPIDPKQAMTMSLAVAILVQFLVTFVYTALSPNSNLIKKTIEKEKWAAFKWANNLSVISYGIIGFVLGALAILSAYPVSQGANWLQDNANWLMTGMSVAGGMIPAIGFGMILSVMLKKQFIPFALLGYICFAWIFDTSNKTWIMGVTFLALAIALIILFASKLTNRESAVKAKGSSEEIAKAMDKIEALEKEDYSDGI